MGIILLGIWWVMSAGLRYVRVTNATIDVQRSCLIALARVTQELAEANQFGLETTGSEVIFSSPRDDSGILRFDVANRLLWHKVVAFYVETVNGVPCLMRKEKMLPKPLSKAPAPPPISSIRNDGSLVPRVVAQNIATFTVVHDNPDDPSTPLDNFLTITAISELRTIESRVGKDFQVKITTSVTLKN